MHCSVVIVIICYLILLLHIETFTPSAGGWYKWGTLFQPHYIHLLFFVLGHSAGVAVMLVN